MPGPSNIESFDNPINGLEAPQGGYEARMREGRYVGALYRQIGGDIGGDIKGLGDAYVAHQTQQEITRGQSNTAKLWSQISDMKNQLGNQVAVDANGKPLTNADGTAQLESAQPDYHARVTQATQALLDNMGTTFKTEGGKRWFNEFSMRLQDEVSRQAAADTSEAQGAQHIKDEQNTTVSMAAAARAQPEQWEALLGAAHSTHDPALSTPVLMEAGAAARSNADISDQRGEAIVTSAVSSFAGKLRDALATGNTDVASDVVERLKQLRDSPSARPYLKVDVDKEIDEATRWGNEAHMAAGRQAKMDKEAEANGVASQITIKLFDAQTHGRTVDPDTMAEIDAYGKSYPQAGTQLRSLQEHALLTNRQAGTGTNVVSDPTVLSGFQSRLSIPEGQAGALTPMEIVTASTGPHASIAPDAAKKLLTDLKEIRNNPKLGTDLSALEREITPVIRSGLGLQHSGITFNMAGGLPTGPLGVPNLQGEIAASMFEQEARAQYTALAQQTTPDKALAALTDPKTGWISQHMPLYKMAAAHPDAQAFLATYGVGGTFQAARTAAGLNSVPARAIPGNPELAKVHAAGPRKPGESIAAYSKRAGL